MRKVIECRKAWLRLRNPAQKYAFVVTTLEAEQGPVTNIQSYSSHQRCSSFSLGKIGDGLGSEQYRAKCNSPLQFTSRSCQSSKQSLQCLVPSSVSALRWLPSTSVKFVHTGPVLDRVILFDSEAGDETRSSTARMDIGSGASESFYSSNVKSSQRKPQPTWDERRSQNAETARQWSLYLNRQQRGFGHHLSGLKLLSSVMPNPTLCTRLYSSDAPQGVAPKAPEAVDHSQRAVVVAIVCNFLVLSLKVGAWFVTSSHVMLAEAVHSLADLANQGLLAYGLISSRRAPDALHPYGYSRERFVWSLISAVGIFCLGCGATIVHGVQNLATAEPLGNVMLAASVIAGSMVMEGASLIVAYGAVKNGAAAEGMSLREYLWRGHDPTSVAVLMEDGAACAGLGIAAIALATAEITGNPMWDPIGSILVGNLLGVVAIFLIQRNRQALLGRSIDDIEMRRIINLLIADPVVEGLYDCKSEVIGPGEYRFKAEIDFNGVVIVQNYLQRAGRDTWMQEFRKAVNNPDGSVLDRVLAEYGEEVVSAVGCEVDRLEKDIQKLVPGIRHVDIEAHNPNGPAPREKFYLY